MPVGIANFTYPIKIGQPGILVRESNDEAATNTFSFDEEHGSCERKYYTPWGSDIDRITSIRNAFLGVSAVTTIAGTKCLTRSLPHGHPNFPDELFATSLRIKGNGTCAKDDNGTASFQEAVCSASYSSLNYEMTGDTDLLGMSDTPYPDESLLLRFVTCDWQPVSKFQTLPKFGPLRWGAGPDGPTGTQDGKPLLNIHPFLLHEADITLTWHDIPLAAVPFTAIRACIGKTNQDDLGHIFSVAGIIPSATLICGLPKLKLRRCRDGSLGYDIAYNFRYKPNGANYFYYSRRNRASAWYITSFDRPVTQFLYPPANFNSLFLPEP